MKTAIACDTARRDSRAVPEAVRGKTRPRADMLALLLLILSSAPSHAGEYGTYNPNWTRALKDYGTTWMYFPDGYGVPQVALLFPEGRSTPSTPQEVGSKDVTFYLYTRRRETPEIIDLEDPKSLWDSTFDASLPTKFIAHGWKSSAESDTVQNVKDAYLQQSDCNVVAVDWSELASSNFYPWSKSYTNPVGKRVAALIMQMVGESRWDEANRITPRRESRKKAKKGKIKIADIEAKLADIHLVGHSLGAHLVGYAGQHLAPYKVARITGLDPAMPLFEILPSRDGHLDETDAEFVDVIHTCAGALGYLGTIGHVDFYPNSGAPVQPGCCCAPEIAEACSHGRSHKLFAESILSNNFIAVLCKSWDSFQNGSCAGAPTTVMGEHTPSSARGVYYLTTRSAPPYAAGEDGTSYTREKRQ